MVGGYARGRDVKRDTRRATPHRPHYNGRHIIFIWYRSPIGHTVSVWSEDVGKRKIFERYGWTEFTPVGVSFKDIAKGFRKIGQAAAIATKRIKAATNG